MFNRCVPGSSTPVSSTPAIVCQYLYAVCPKINFLHQICFLSSLFFLSFLFLLGPLLLTALPAASWRMLASIWDCSVLNSSTISKMFKWAFPARVLTLLCHPSRLFVRGQSSKWTFHSLVPRPRQAYHRLHAVSSPAFLYCKWCRAGRGLGTRLDIPLTEAKIAIKGCPLKIIHKVIISLAIRISWKTQFREVDKTGVDEKGSRRNRSWQNRYQTLKCQIGYSINLDYIIYIIYYVDPLFHILGCKLLTNWGS